MNNNKTPIADFVRQYATSGTSRLHMPGHKGKSFLGCEAFDITEIKGADSLYEAESIIAESEENATKLFGSKKTLLGTEGSSQCIRAMLYLAMISKKVEGRPTVIAARNVHKSFIYAATLLDFDVVWLWPEDDATTICSCYVSAKTIENEIEKHKSSVVAVYVTSPDYLGGMDDIKEIADVCHAHEVVLAVDNAHGAYLHFLENSKHPLDLGADICCDSAHKTLPVLTGGAYLHIGKNAPDVFCEQAKHAMSLFGSTSPSYLIMTSLDLCNEYLANGYRQRLCETIAMRNKYCDKLHDNGWRVRHSDELKITVEIPKAVDVNDVVKKLNDNNIECEYADPDFLVLMITPENTREDLDKLILALGVNTVDYEEKEAIALCKTTSVMPIRQAMFTQPETVTVDNALGRICRVPTVSCPPAIPIAVPGEIIDEKMITLFKYYGIEEIDVVK